MRSSIVALSLALVSCGALGIGGNPIEHDNEITVRRYEDKDGVPVNDGQHLGLTYWTQTDAGAKHGEPGFNCLVSEILRDDDDPDRLTRVVMHELLSVLTYEDGSRMNPERPEGEGWGWYVFHAAGLEPFQPILPEEAAWIATHGYYRVMVSGPDVDWLEQPTNDAIERLNDAAGVVIYVR